MELGLATTVDHLTDYGPAGCAGRQALEDATLSDLDRIEPTTEPDRLAQLSIRSRVSSSQALRAAREDLRPLRASYGPVQVLRSTFDYLPRESRDDWAVVGELLAQMPHALTALRSSLEAGMDAGVVGARRQALGAAADAERWSDRGPSGFFPSLVANASTDLSTAAERAAVAYGELGRFLSEDYAASADPRDGVGHDRYQLWANDYCGGELDLLEAYEWGWDDLRRCLAVEQEACNDIEPGSSMARARAVLRNDEAGWATSSDYLRDWLQALLDRAVSDLDGTHFDIPALIRPIDVVLASADEHPVPSYAPPSEDFSRAGRIWWPYSGGPFRPQSLVSVAYHEGVPGHHLQTGMTRVRAAELSRFQRAFYLNFHGEGWALYAEELMGEMGYLETPEARLSMAAAQTARALRVVFDIGMHLELDIPRDAPWNHGETMTPAVAEDIFVTRGSSPAAASSQVYRYLGLPGQAITYKLGQRAWHDARQRATSAQGASFDLRAFHSAALGLGPLGIDDLGRETARALVGSER